jgi:hypothetical protein
MPAWNETEDYRAAHAAHTAELQKTLTIDDPSERRVAQLVAENTWLGRQAELRDAHSQAEAGQRAMEAAIAEVRARHPQVPEDLLALARTPEDVARVAVAAAALAPAKGGGARPSRAATTTGGPPPSAPPEPASTPSSESARRWNDRPYMADLVERCNTQAGDGSGKPGKAIEEFMELAFDNRVGPLMGFGADGTKEG